MNELFRDISGYEGLYQVSNFGNVRSLGMWKKGNGNSSYFQEGRVLKSKKEKKGYLRVELYKDGKGKMHTVHRLVAQAFIDNPDNLPEINHKDEDKTNNVVSNLEWCDRKYNANYGTLGKRISEALRGVKRPDIAEALSKKVLQLTLDYIFVKEWASISECGRNGFSISAVSMCCRGVYCSQGNVYKGYRWMYAEDYYKIFAA